MNLDALRFAHFALLDEAITDWDTTVTNLEDLQRAADSGLRKAANNARWSGENATVSKAFIGKTAGEFADAHTEATSIRNILRDTRDELKDYQRKLNEAIERGLKKNLTVVETGGGGFTVTMNIHPDRAGRGTTTPEHSQSDVNALRDEIQKILDDATESDTSANTVLQALVDQSRLGFSDASYKDRDAAAQAVKTADELAALARKDRSELTVADFDKLNNGLKRYAHDALFAERLATKLGARGTLEFWAGFNDPNALDPRLNHARADRFDDLQKNLSMTLAQATQSDTAAMTEWKRQVVDLGDKPLGRSGGFPLGVQVMSNLMRWGDYDDQFLNDYGTKLMATEKKMTSNGRTGAWGYSRGIDPLLNHTGTDSGWDPLTGYLKGLSNSPDAATEFFNQEFVSKDDADNPFERDPDGDGKNSRASLSNFQYLFEERDWPLDADAEGEAGIAGRNNLALALEAATTGHPAGELPTADTPAHTPERARLMENLVESISDDNKRLTDHSYMSDSIGQIASEYLPDINRAMANNMEGRADSTADFSRLFPVAGSDADLEYKDVTRFLLTVGQNEEGYAAVEVGQKDYMANLMDYHLDPDLPEVQRYAADPERAVEQIGLQSGEISGILAIGRQEAVAGPAHQRDEDFDHAVSQWKNVLSGGIGTGIGVGTTFIASPAVGAAVGGGAGTVGSVVLEQLFKDVEGSAGDEAGAKIGEFWQSGMSSNMEYTRRAAEVAVETHGMTEALPDADKAARVAARQGFSNAEAAVRGMAPELVTEL